MSIDVDKLVIKLDNLANSQDVQKALTKAALEVEKQAKLECPVHHGQLRNSITNEVEEGLAVVGTNVEYAPYVHQGTGIFAIDQDGRKDPWRYQDQEGNWHTTIGQKPNRFLTRALDKKRDYITDLFKTMIKEESNG